YLVDTCGKIDPDREEYGLDVLTLAESILENPELVLMRQVDKLKRDKLGELKAAGVEYDQRMEELEKIEYPKPNAEFVYATFNDFAKVHPWVGTENIRPKSVAREMVEQYMSFGEYVREYGTERGEGLLLRYLSDVYKTLVQTVPEWAKDARVNDIVTFFGAIVRQVDSSLLDEWERMKDPDRKVFEPAPDPDEPRTHDVTRDLGALPVRVRNLAFSLVRALAAKDYVRAAEILADPEWTSLRLEQAMLPFWEANPRIRTDARARSPENLGVEQKDGAWEVTQSLWAEDDAPSDWHFKGTIDLARARDAARPVLALTHLGT